MKTIPLTQGKVALVDDEDYERLAQYNWCAFRKPRRNRDLWYAMRKENGRTVLMHIAILGKRPGFVIDHINGDGLDNRRSNLRFVSRRQNLQNVHYRKSSRYPGVHWHVAYQKWQAMIGVGGRPKYLGRYADEREAFLAYQKACLRLAGEEVIGVTASAGT